MSFLRLLAAVPFLATILTQALLAQGKVSWSLDLDTALARAAEQKTLVLVALYMPGERASDEFVKVHYNDPKLAALSQKTVNLLLKVGVPGDLSPDERAIRERYLEIGEKALVAAPHHIFIRPGEGGGQVVSSAGFDLTVGQLEWLWADAIKKADPAFAWEPSDRTRAPESLVYGEVSGTGVKPPPSRGEVKTAIEALRKGAGGWFGRLEHYDVLIRSEEKAAIKYGTTAIRNVSTNSKGWALRTIGDVSPKPWHKFVSEHLDHRTDRVRDEAARALEKIREPKSLSALKRMYRKEKSIDIKGRILRAMAAVGPNDRTVLQTIRKVIDKEKKAELRVQAAVAIGVLENRKVVSELIALALDDDESDVRTAAAYAAGSRRDPVFQSVLERRRQDEPNTEVAQWMSVAIAAINGGDLREFDRFLEKVAGDRTRGAQDRQLEEWLARRGGRRGGEEEGDGEGKGGKEGEGKGEGKGGKGKSNER